MPEQPSLPNDVLEVIRFRHPLTNTARCIARGEPIKIVAIGSSSTKGEGGTPYPELLETALKLRYPATRVVNQGIKGEEAADELARFEKDVVAEHPTMVIWQIGTNAAWKGYDLDEVEDAIRAGLFRLKTLSSDIVLMDLQYTTAMIDSATIANSNDMVARIAGIARHFGVNVFRRFALMRFWHVTAGAEVKDMTETVRPWLHQRDYTGIVQTLDQVIWERLQRDGVTFV